MFINTISISCKKLDKSKKGFVSPFHNKRGLLKQLLNTSKAQIGNRAS